MKSKLRTLQNSLWWILPMFIAVTGMLMNDSIPTRLMVSTIVFTEMVILFITWFAAMTIKMKEPAFRHVLGHELKESRQKPDPFFMILMGHVFFISLIWLPLAIYMNLNGKETGILYFGYSVGISTWTATGLLLFRWLRAKREPKNQRVLTREEAMG